MTLENYLASWRFRYGATPDTFPDERKMREATRMDKGTYEKEMLRLLDAGIVGMDGFRYCWPEVAKENRRRLLESMEYQRRRTA